MTLGTILTPGLALASIQANGHYELRVIPSAKKRGQPEQCAQRGCVSVMVKSYDSHATDAHLHLNLTVQEHWGQMCLFVHYFDCVWS